MNMMGNSGDKIFPSHTLKETVKRFQRLLLQQCIEHKERNRIDRYTYRWFGDKRFSGVPLYAWCLDIPMDATETEIWNIIKQSPVKSCELDPWPTWLLKECIAELVPLITDIVNMSLRKSMIPKSLKTALIRPLLKKTGLYSDILKNYRPVSNLSRKSLKRWYQGGSMNI